MPAVRNTALWNKAVAIAQIARDGTWKNHAPGALFFHARYVSPGWRKTRIAQIDNRTEEHTSELQSLMRLSYAVFCLKKKNRRTNINTHKQTYNKDHNSYDHKTTKQNIST